ncbi:hypothetical protein [Sphingomonas jaspsi]|uniref:hypothetical protein n=1 Tax=Sphingomonas jaspsi TaxID=392409 RepID=UPI0004BC6D73|nr:hypothetical protein [Sphingomonas jaspsi]
MTEGEEFFAWLDGELDGEAADRVAARVAGSPDLAKRAEQHRALTAGLRGAFASATAEASPPPRFESADVIDFSQAKGKAAKHAFGVPQWAAIAATLVLGVVGGAMVTSRDTGPVVTRDGQLYAAAALDTALDRQLASTQGSDEAIRIGLTFKDKSGVTCRSFSGQAGDGLACREGGDWKVEGLFAPKQAGGDYRMAAGEDPRLAALIDDRIDGEPLDASSEAEARRRDWR